MRAQIVKRMPANTPDRKGWAADIYAAFAALEIEPDAPNLCAVLAVTEQESTFQADPPVPDLPKIARAEIDRRAARLGVPRFAVSVALKLPSPDGRSYAERIGAVRTERELSEIFESFVGRVPLGERLFAGLNPVRTGGPMQVSIAFAERAGAATAIRIPSKSRSAARCSRAAAACTSASRTCSTTRLPTTRISTASRTSTRAAGRVATRHSSMR